MSTIETPIEMVSRHILEGEMRLANQLALIERLRALGLQMDSAHEFLDCLCRSQEQHEEYRRMLIEDQALGLRDDHGQLLLTRGL